MNGPEEIARGNQGGQRPQTQPFWVYLSVQTLSGAGSWPMTVFPSPSPANSKNVMKGSPLGA